MPGKKKKAAPAKKAAAKKPAKKNFFTGKSAAGKPALQEVFNTLKPLLKKYAPPFEVRNESDRSYNLWSRKEFEFMGRKFNEVYFAGLVIQSNYVGFYYMPVYGDPSLRKKMKPELLKLLKGKSCFHVKSAGPELVSQVKDALALGLSCYKERGWV